MGRAVSTTSSPIQGSCRSPVQSPITLACRGRTTGTMATLTVKWAAYNPAGFSQLPVFNGNWEWYTYNPPWLTIGADFQHPASLSPGGLPETMVIRRWMAEQSGDLQVDFHIAKRGWDGSGGNGVVGYILQNGAVVWSQYLSGTDSTGVTAALQLPNVAAGDFIEFAVGPNGGSDEFDTTVFTAQIALVGEPFTVGPETVDVLVHPVNDAPVLDGVPANAAISEMVEYTFDADATDVDLPPQALTFSILDAPLGAVIDPVTGVFTWTPSEAQGPQTYSFTVVASDGADATEAPITITVSEVNLPPVLSGVPSSETIAEMVEYTFDADATDVDVPAQTLTFSLVDGPAGAAVDPVTGVFTWTPTEAQGPGSYALQGRRQRRLSDEPKPDHDHGQRGERRSGAGGDRRENGRRAGGADSSRQRPRTPTCQPTR